MDPSFAADSFGLTPAQKAVTGIVPVQLYPAWRGDLAADAQHPF
jgi:hypothetical protein